MTRSSPGTAKKATARTLLTDWANQQDGWVRILVAELLPTRSPIGKDSLAHALHVLLSEKDLTDEPTRHLIPDVKDLGGADGEQTTLRLTALGDVTHVNALSAGQRIDFHPALTILFGENAAGKSGYCRILKRLANVRSVEEILDNVESKAPGTPTATIEFCLGDDEHELKWDNGAAVAPFGRMAVFDSRAVGLHVDDDLGYQYTPGDLVLFRLCNLAVEGVRSLLEEHIQSRRLDLPLSPASFTRGTEVYTIFESLGPATDAERVRALGTFDAELEETLRRLQVAVAALQPDNVDARAKAASADIDLFQEIFRVLRVLLAFDDTSYPQTIAAMPPARAP